MFVASCQGGSEEVAGVICATLFSCGGRRLWGGWGVVARWLRLTCLALRLDGGLELRGRQVAAEAGGLLWFVVVRHEGRRDSSGT